MTFYFWHNPTLSQQHCTYIFCKGLPQRFFSLPSETQKHCRGGCASRAHSNFVPFWNTTGREVTNSEGKTTTTTTSPPWATQRKDSPLCPPGSCPRASQRPGGWAMPSSGSWERPAQPQLWLLEGRKREGRKGEEDKGWRLLFVRGGAGEGEPTRLLTCCYTLHPD